MCLWLNKPAISGVRMSLKIFPSGEAEWRENRFSCSIGKDRIGKEKVEGDNKTPAGSFPLRKLYFRPDRVPKPRTVLPTIALKPLDGWCSDPRDRNYNQFIELPSYAEHERLWRSDNLYDLIGVIGYNDTSVIPGAGSAIFLHIATNNYSPTKGCVALSKGDLSKIFLEWKAKDQIIISPE